MALKVFSLGPTMHIFGADKVAPLQRMDTAGALQNAPLAGLTRRVRSNFQPVVRLPASPAGMPLPYNPRPMRSL